MGQLHNQPAPAEWKIDPNVLEDISIMQLWRILALHQKGKRMNYQPMNASTAATNIEKVRSVVKKARKEFDNEKV